MAIMLSRATEADAPTLIPIGRAAFANNRLFNIFQPDPENDKVSLADQQAAYLSWRTERSTRRLRGEGKHWFKAIDSQTGSTVGFAGIYSPETYNADEQSGEPSEFVNKDLLSVKEGAKTQGKDQFLVGRKDVWYVPAMVVHPDCQGRGIGTLLLSELCKVAEKAGQDIYLEATPSGKGLYLNAGFENLGSIELLEGEYVLTFMLKRAKKP